MEISLSEINLTKTEQDEIERLLCNKKKGLSDLEQIWFLMDLVWDECLCDNVNLNLDNIGKFYSHPVWILNGLFIEQDKQSMGHREAIANWVSDKNFKNIVDYGGGFATLARLISNKDNKVSISIYEPYPSDYGLNRVAEQKNINFTDKLTNECDCLIATDVLEHVPDPIEHFVKMISSVKLDGYLVVANCFHPVIKCHLPQTFHYRYSFDIFAKILGLKVEGLLEGSHATIYKKVKNVNPNWKLIHTFIRLSNLLFSLLQKLKFILQPIRKMF
jgi:2-polyprenyl-6-hydroxyphenyl methylase/3-demethylubiquinone-9 3-methyltransferase